MDTLVPTVTFSLPSFSNTLEAIPISTTGFYAETSTPKQTFHNSPDRIPLIVGCVFGALTFVFLLVALYFAIKLRQRRQLTKTIEEEKMLPSSGHKSLSSLSDPNSTFAIAVKRAGEIPDSPVEKNNLY